MSLAELLINAVAQGRVRGMQFKRNWTGPDKDTFDDLNKVIEDRLNGARRVAVQEALHKVQEEHPVFKLRALAFEAASADPTVSTEGLRKLREYFKPTYEALEARVQNNG